MDSSKSALRRLRLFPALIIAALVCLHNPYFHTLDLLPDVIGYLCLYIAFFRLAASDESLAAAKRGFVRLAWLSVARAVGFVWSQGFVSGSERPTVVLCLVTVLGVLELMVALPTCTQLFRGLSYRATRQDGINILRGNLTAATCLWCQIFAVIKVALGVLPEITALADASFRQGVIPFNWYAYVIGFRLIAMLIGGVIGIIWLIKLCRYVSYVAKDATFWQNVADYCEADAAAHPARRSSRHLAVARWAWIIALFLTANFFIEDTNYIPSYLTPAALLVALAVLWPYLPRALAYVAAVVHSVHLIGSIWFYTKATAFLSEHTIYEIRREFHVREAYTGEVTIPAFVDAVLLFLSLGVLCAIVITLIRRYACRTETATYLHSAQELDDRRVTALLRAQILPAILGALTCVTHAVYYVVWADPDLIDRTGSIFTLYALFERFWAVDFAVALVFALFAYLRLSQATDALDRDKMIAAVGEVQV